MSSNYLLIERTLILPCTLFLNVVLFTIQVGFDMLNSMIKNYNRQPAEEYQNQFYSTSIDWITSLKKRHDPQNRIGFLPNDTTNFPFQSVDQALITHEIPDTSTNDERINLQAGILELIRLSADSIMGTGNFEKYANDIGRSVPTIQHMLAQPNSNIATVSFHPNVMALAIYSAANAYAMSKAADTADDFDLFSFRRQNILAINPALAITTFNGIPTMDVLGATATIVKTPPPTKSTIGYGYSKELRRYMNHSGKDAMQDHLATLTESGKSAWMTIDPTASTINEIIENDVVVALNRKAVSRPLRLTLQNTCKLALPATMVIDDKSARWFVGDIVPVETEDDFESIVRLLDRETERLAGVPILIERSEGTLGKLAVSNLVAPELTAQAQFGNK